VAKVSQVRSSLLAKGLELAVQVDGGVTEDNISDLAKAGANTFVAGSSIFRAIDRNAQIEKLRALAKGHHHG
jgi:ribulose-phosphate 3-epimerase